MPETSTSKLRPESHKFRHRLEFALFNSLKHWGEGASEKTLRRGAFILDVLLYHGLRICRKIVSINLELAFPELSVKERREIARSNYRWFTRFCMDVLHMDVRYAGFAGEKTCPAFPSLDASHDKTTPLPNPLSSSVFCSKTLLADSEFYSGAFSKYSMAGVYSGAWNFR